MRYFQIPDKRGYEYILIPMITAFLVRIIYHLFEIPDFWGDAYHNILISKSTIENGWAYTDYKGREVVWLPFYRYFTAFFMYLFNSYDLTVPHLINIIIGTVSCGVLAKVSAIGTNKQTGAIAGLILALLPWHIAYSHMNMPEMTGSLILLLIVMFQRMGKWMWLFPLGFVGVLTKNEVTLYTGVFGLYIIWLRDWKSAAALVIGCTIGLGTWSFWNFQQTNSLFWWISERSIGSGWDQLFYQEKASGRWFIPPLSILQVFPLSLVLIFQLHKFPKLKGIKERLLIALALLVLFNWMFVILMNFGYLPSPDARYFIITLPILCLVFIWWIYKLDNAENLLKKSLLTIIIILFLQVPTFHFLHHTLNPSIELGRHIQQNNFENGNWWNDFPTSIYYAGFPEDHSFSSMMMVPKKDRYSAEFNDRLIENISSNNIKFIVFQDVSFSYVGTIWPQMKMEEHFIWNEIQFEPIYSYNNPKSVSVWDQIRHFIEAGRKSSIWKLTYEE